MLLTFVRFMLLFSAVAILRAFFCEHAGGHGPELKLSVDGLGCTGCGTVCSLLL